MPNTRATVTLPAPLHERDTREADRVERIGDLLCPRPPGAGNQLARAARHTGGSVRMEGGLPGCRAPASRKGRAPRCCRCARESEEGLQLRSESARIRPQIEPASAHHIRRVARSLIQDRVNRSVGRVPIERLARAEQRFAARIGDRDPGVQNLCVEAARDRA